MAADHVAGLDLARRRAGTRRDVQRQLAGVVADRAEPLVRRRRRRRPAGSPSSTSETPENPSRLRRPDSSIGLARSTDAVAGQGELLVDALGLDLAVGAHVDLHGLGVDDLDRATVVRGRGGRCHGHRHDGHGGEAGADGVRWSSLGGPPGPRRCCSRARARARAPARRRARARAAVLGLGLGRGDPAAAPPGRRRQKPTATHSASAVRVSSEFSTTRGGARS